jgi:peptidoglycan/LPS O-acetylase OafA/YrhL
MRENDGAGPGFDAVRLALALSVVLWHSRQISYGRGTIWLPVYMIVPAFFALSGFLVAGSMVRVKNVFVFLALRGLRILPALMVEITLSALILGPLVTSLPLARYVADPEFAHYFTNVVGIIRYRLPGVFVDNPLPGIVNGQLWTVPGELHCYIALAILMVTRMATKSWLMMGVFVVLATAECLTSLLPRHHYTSSVLNSQEMLVLCFLCGNVAYLWRDHIVWDGRVFVLAIAVFFLTGAYAPTLAFLFGTVGACYFVVYLGLCRLPRPGGGDYSYGIYLYSFPLQQAVAYVFPALREWYFNLLLAGPLVVLFAMLSWHNVEKPALRIKRLFVGKQRQQPALRATP